jgi:hypothetical protein
MTIITKSMKSQKPLKSNPNKEKEYIDALKQIRDTLRGPINDDTRINIIWLIDEVIDD